jgi:hypothetical protein
MGALVCGGQSALYHTAADITERKIDLYIKHRLKMGRSRTTVNRELQRLGQTLRLARRKKLFAEVPHIEMPARASLSRKSLRRLSASFPSTSRILRALPTTPAGTVGRCSAWSGGISRAM